MTKSQKLQGECCQGIGKLHFLPGQIFLPYCSNLSCKPQLILRIIHSKCPTHCMPSRLLLSKETVYVIDTGQHVYIFMYPQGVGDLPSSIVILYIICCHGDSFLK